MRLQDGINGYLRFLREEQADSAWRGQNFVFDRRTLVEPPPRARRLTAALSRARTIRSAGLDGCTACNVYHACVNV